MQIEERGKKLQWAKEIKGKKHLKIITKKGKMIF